MDEATLSQVQAIAKRYTAGLRPPGKVWEDADSLDVTGSDVLFGTGEMRWVYQQWMALEVDHIEGAVVGDASQITLARCDGYLATWFALQLYAQGSNKPPSPSRYNTILEMLLPRAAESVLNECRTVLLGETEGRAELEIPFDYNAFQEHCRDLEFSPLRVHELPHDSDLYNDVCARMDAEEPSSCLSQWHELDFFTSRRRNPTLAFDDLQDKKDYCVLKGSFFLDSVCGWMGNTRDAFVGVGDHTAGDYIALGESNCACVFPGGDGV